MTDPHADALARLGYELLLVLLTVAPPERDAILLELGETPTMAQIREVMTRRGHVCRDDLN